MRASFPIGELARLAGTNANTIRYYESLGLLTSPKRSESGYRLYTEADCTLLIFIRKAKRIGLSLAEIKEVLDCQAQGKSPCGQVVHLLEHKIEEIDHRVQELRAFRAELAALKVDMSSEGEQKSAALCRYIERIALSGKD